MLIAGGVERLAHRRSPGFSLGEATQIRRDILAHKHDVKCPRCAGRLGTQNAGGADGATWMAKCPDCGLSLIVHHRTGDVS